MLCDKSGASLICVRAGLLLYNLLFFFMMFFVLIAQQRIDVVNRRLCNTFQPLYAEHKRLIWIH